jgi:hypothetical protein
MLLHSTLLLCFSHALLVSAGLASRQAMLNKRGLGKVQKREEQPSLPNFNAYLNNKTQPYAVNGSALPEVKFGTEKALDHSGPAIADNV